MRHRQSDLNVDVEQQQPGLAEYEEIFNLLIHHGALWFEDEYMSRFSGQDASFWIDFLSSYSFRTERFFVHNAMRRHYKKSIKPHIVSGPLAPVERVMAQYFVAFPMVDIPMDDDKSSDEDMFGEDVADRRDGGNMVDVVGRTRNDGEDRVNGRGRCNGLYAKILSMRRSNEVNKDNVTLCKQREYTVVNEDAVRMNLVVHDERIYGLLHIGDVIHIRDAAVFLDERAMSLVPPMTKTPSISVVYDAAIKDKFENVC